MTFRYPFQSILRLRESLERQEELRLFAIAATVARLRMQIEECERARLEARRLASRELIAGSAGAVLQFANLCDAAAVEVQRQLQIRLVDAEQERVKQLDVYRNARQRRKIFEGLRDQQEASYDREIAHRQQESADESFLMRYVGELAE